MCPDCIYIFVSQMFKKRQRIFLSLIQESQFFMCLIEHRCWQATTISGGDVSSKSCKRKLFSY